MLDHKFIQTELLDEDGNFVFDSDGYPVMTDKIFQFEVVENVDGNEITYVVEVSICADCGKVIERRRYQKPSDEELQAV